MKYLFAGKNPAFKIVLDYTDWPSSVKAAL